VTVTVTVTVPAALTPTVTLTVVCVCICGHADAVTPPLSLRQSITELRKSVGESAVKSAERMSALEQQLEATTASLADARRQCSTAESSLSQQTVEVNRLESRLAEVNRLLDSERYATPAAWLRSGECHRGLPPPRPLSSSSSSSPPLLLPLLLLLLLLFLPRFLLVFLLLSPPSRKQALPVLMVFCRVARAEKDQLRAQAQMSSGTLSSQLASATSELNGLRERLRERDDTVTSLEDRMRQVSTQAIAAQEASHRTVR
jgi:septal ring factor EnvC (AmiA/AmiB activator)